MRLTAIRSEEALVDRHVLESVVAAGHAGAEEGRFVDIGSGNGYPALPIKCLNPGLEATLLEPSLRKSIFLRRVVRELGLTGVEVRRERIESREDLKRYAPVRVISMRAVAVLEEVLQGAGETLSEGGRALLFLGAEKARAVRGMLPPGLRLLDETPLPGRTRSCLVIVQRI